MVTATLKRQQSSRKGNGRFTCSGCLADADQGAHIVKEIWMMHCLVLRHSTDPDDPQISEQISEKIPADVAVPGYPDPWHPDPPDADMA